MESHLTPILQRRDRDDLVYAVGPPPKGGPRNRASEIFAIDGVIFGIHWILVILRFFTRAWVTRNLGWDDAMVLLAAVTNSVGMGLYVNMVLYGLGRHKYYLTQYDYKQFSKYDYMDWVQMLTTCAIAKIAICLLLLRLSKFSKIKRFIYALIVFIILTNFPPILLFAIHCSPRERYWNKQIDGHCWPQDTVVLILRIQGAFSILTDFIGAALPIFLLWNVKISWKNKIAIWLLMGFGVATGVACILRTYLTYQIKSDDVTWDAVGIFVAKILETNFSIMAACLPLMKPLFAYLHGLCTGKPLDLRARNFQNPSLSLLSHSSRGFWSRLRGSNLTHPGSKIPKPVDPAAASVTNMRSQASSNGRRSWPLPRWPLSQHSAKTLGANNEYLSSTNSIDLPIQGTTEKMKGQPPRLQPREGMNEGIQLEDIV